MNDLIQFWSFFSTVGAIIGLALWTILAIVLAQSVSNDVHRLHTEGRETRFFGSPGWALMTLILDLFGMAFSWLVYHSNLRHAASDRRMVGR